MNYCDKYNNAILKVFLENVIQIGQYNRFRLDGVFHTGDGARISTNEQSGPSRSNEDVAGDCKSISE